MLCAILVISIHVAPLGLYDNQTIQLINYGIQNCFSRIAVPLFFVISGFFLYRKTSVEDFSLQPTEAYIKKMTGIYLIWTVIYSPWRIKSFLEDPEGIAHGVIGYLRDIVFNGSYTHLWFMPALIFAVALVSYLLSKHIKLKKILLVAAFFYVIGLFGQSWYGLIVPLSDIAPGLWTAFTIIEKIIVTTRNGLFMGFLFVGIGAYFAFCGSKIKKRTAIIGFVASLVLMFIEAFTVRYLGIVRSYDMYVFLVPLTVFAFVLVLNWNIPGNSSIYTTIRVLSSLVFYIQWWTIWIIVIIFHYIGYKLWITPWMFFVTVILSIGMSYLIYRVSQRPRFKWFRRLYS